MSSVFLGIGRLMALIVHIWTVVIAYNESGLFASILTLIFPMLSEIYWVFMMWGDKNLYVFCAFLATALILTTAFFDDRGQY